MRRWHSAELQTGEPVGSNGWSCCRSVGVSDVILILKTFPPKMTTEPLQSLLKSEKRIVGPRGEARVRSAKGQLEAVAGRMTVFVIRNFNES